MSNHPIVVYFPTFMGCILFPTSFLKLCLRIPNPFLLLFIYSFSWLYFSNLHVKTANPPFSSKSIQLKIVVEILPVILESGSLPIVIWKTGIIRFDKVPYSLVTSQICSLPEVNVLSGKCENWPGTARGNSHYMTVNVT